MQSPSPEPWPSLPSSSSFWAHGGWFVLLTCSPLYLSAHPDPPQHPRPSLPSNPQLPLTHPADTQASMINSPSAGTLHPLSTLLSASETGQQLHPFFTLDLIPDCQSPVRALLTGQIYSY